MNKAPLPYLLTILAVLALTMLLIVLFMNPPMGDLIELGKLLGITAVISAGVGYFSHRFGLWRQFRTLSSAIIVSYMIAAGLSLLNVWWTAQQMFINKHDLSLATLLLLFASGISVSFGIFIASSSTQALKQLSHGAERVSEGDLTTRVPVEGNDEIARLATAFNSMVERLEQTAEKEHALEEARRNLVAWASHDLRTPLASLRAMMDALSEGIVEDSATVTRYVRQSRTEIERMSTLIDDLFVLAQIDAGGLALVFESASLCDLISDTLESFSAPASRAGVHIEGVASPGIDPVFMAPDKIGRVLNNLIENALRHTPSGGSVRVEASLDDEETVTVAVSDTGTGIDPKYRAHIFDRFFRGEPSRSREGYKSGGTGLGLAISKGIVEAHGGAIWLDSDRKPGTAILFSLPRTGQ